MADVKDQANELANGAMQIAERAAENPWVERIARMGYFTRGVLYGLIGYLAIRVIFSGQGQLTDREGVLSTIAGQPFGRIMLILIAVGLLGMFIWGVVRAFADPYNKGSDLKGLVSRAAYLVTGISYGALLFPTLRLVTGSGQQSGGSSQNAEQAAAGIMNRPWGPWLVGGVGLGLIAVGFAQIYQGYKGKFEEQFKIYDMTNQQYEWAIRMGRIGRVARGVVLIIIGFLAFLAARTLDPQKVGGLDQALAYLAGQPYGPLLLALVALGLIAYAIFSFMGALWFRIKQAS